MAKAAKPSGRRSFQERLDRINLKFGGIGSVAVAVFLLILLTLTLIKILEDSW